MAKSDDSLKTRKVCFSRRGKLKQAEEAMLLLKDVSSIKNLTLINAYCISITYDIRKLSLKIIEEALEEVGFILDIGLWQRIKRAICDYCEDAERERLGIVLEHHRTGNKLSLNEKLAQDPRPNDWRHYTQ